MPIDIKKINDFMSQGNLDEGCDYILRKAGELSESQPEQADQLAAFAERIALIGSVNKDIVHAVNKFDIESEAWIEDLKKFKEKIESKIFSYIYEMEELSEG